MNGEQENLFDAHLLKTFKVGDLVSWKHLKAQIKEYGFIQEIYSEKKGINRKFMFAKVIKTLFFEVLCVLLLSLHHVEKQEPHVVHLPFLRCW